MIRQRVHQLTTGLLTHRGRPSNRGGHQTVIRERAQVGQVHAVGEAPELVGRDLQSKAGLADTAWPRESEQAPSLEKAVASP